MSLSPVRADEVKAEGARLEKIGVSFVSPSLQIGSEYIPCRSKRRVVRAVCQQATTLGLLPTRLVTDVECTVKEGCMYLSEYGAFEYKKNLWISHYVWESCMLINNNTRVIIAALEYNAPIAVDGGIKLTGVTLSHTPIMTQNQLADFVMRTTLLSNVCGFQVGTKFAVAMRDGTGFRCIDRRCDRRFSSHKEWASHYKTVCIPQRPFVSFVVGSKLRVGVQLSPFIEKGTCAHYASNTWMDTHHIVIAKIRAAINELYAVRHKEGYCICTTDCCCANKVWRAESVYIPLFPKLPTIGELCSIART